MGDFVSKLKEWWASAELMHKGFAIGGAALAVLVIACIFIFAGRPHMAQLFSGLPANEQGTVVQELEKAGIKTEANERGDVLVANDRLAEARMKLAVANKLPASGGFTDFDKEIAAIGLMNTPPVERERLKGILEQRLAESITSIDGITGARVHIVLGEDKAFLRDEEPASASITIVPAASAQIGKNQGKAIAILVKNSVPKLRLENISVLNNKMDMLFDGHDSDSAVGHADTVIAAEDAESRKRTEDLQRRLDQIYGAGSTLVSVHLELDFTKRTKSVDAVTPSDPVTLSKTTETLDGSKPSVGGAAGAASNIPGQPGAPGSTDKSVTSSYNRTSTTLQPGATQTHETDDFAPGTVKSESINVIGNADKLTDTTSLTSIIDGELGSKAPDPNFTRQITLVKFDTSAAKAEAAAQAGAAMNARIQQLIAMIPMIALIGVGFFVLRQVVKITRPQPAVMESVELSSVAGGRPLAGGEMAMDVSGVEISPEALMEANGGVLPEGVRINPSNGLVILDGTENLSEEDRMRIVKGISAKVNVPLEQIKRMCQDRPEAVAMLIKGWLLEEKRA